MDCLQSDQCLMRQLMGYQLIWVYMNGKIYCLPAKSPPLLFIQAPVASSAPFKMLPVISQRVQSLKFGD